MSSWSAIALFFASFRYWERESVMAAIDRLEYIAGQTNTSGALDVSRIFVFNASRGDRPDVTNVAVIITDGRATDPTTVQPAIDRLHAANVTTYVVGVTDAIDEQSLKQLASDPKQASRHPPSSLLLNYLKVMIRNLNRRPIVFLLNR